MEGTQQRKSNAAWDALCQMTDSLFPQFGARPAAFNEACRQRPDLAAVAIAPDGKPLNNAGAREITTGAKVEDSPLVKAAEALAAAAQRPQRSILDFENRGAQHNA